MDQLDEARKIQKDCLNNHLPCPPVVWWRAEIIDNNGKIDERVESKCNSYIRNGLNLMALNSMYLPESAVPTDSTPPFQNGLISFKKQDGKMLNASYPTVGYNKTVKPTIRLGSNTSPESLDIYNILIPSDFVNNGSLIEFDFDDINNKLINSITSNYVNTSGSDITVTEAGIQITVTGNGTGTLLVVRDLLAEPIIVPPTKHIVFTYNFELLY
ncbi:MAG: hypothetical protein GX660_04330 [Clostridiaceae bacterium]|nr:hypothetical protein [Clostridiaceae bacterium]